MDNELYKNLPHAQETSNQFTPEASAKREIDSMNKFLAGIGRAPLSKESEEEILAFFQKSYGEQPNLEAEE